MYENKISIQRRNRSYARQYEAKNNQELIRSRFF